MDSVSNASHADGTLALTIREAEVQPDTYLLEAPPASQASQGLDGILAILDGMNLAGNNEYPASYRYTLDDNAVDVRWSNMEFEPYGGFAV